MAENELEMAEVLARLERYVNADSANGAEVRKKIAPQPVETPLVERDLTPEEMARTERVRPNVENSIVVSDVAVGDRLLVEAADRQKARNRR